jgi:hypothetical protein
MLIPMETGIIITTMFLFYPSNYFSKMLSMGQSFNQHFQGSSESGRIEVLSTYIKAVWNLNNVNSSN